MNIKSALTVPRVSTAPFDVRAVILETSLQEWERHIPCRGGWVGHIHLSRSSSRLRWSRNPAEHLFSQRSEPLKAGLHFDRSCRSDWGWAILGFDQTQAPRSCPVDRPVLWDPRYCSGMAPTSTSRSKFPSEALLPACFPQRPRLLSGLQGTKRVHPASRDTGWKVLIHRGLGEGDRERLARGRRRKQN